MKVSDERRRPSGLREPAQCGAVLVVLGLSMLLAGCLSNKRWQLTEGERAHAFEATIRKRVNLRFLLYLPEQYAAHDQRWPLLIFLHGASERGEDLERVKDNGPPKIVQTQKDFPFIVVSPQVSADMAWDSDALNALLDELLDQLPIDPERVYLTGLSMGGYGAWNFASAHPERIAAIAPISGAGDAVRACRLKDMPIWAFHGAEDPIVPLFDDQKMVNAVRACGGHVEFTVYPNVGHDAWTQTYANPELYRWLLEHRRVARVR